MAEEKPPGSRDASEARSEANAERSPAGRFTRPDTRESPPFLGSWKNVYTLVVVELAVLVVVFWAFARWAS
ncbi:hypothetical protein L6R52_42345 [Myxococcota bacterium]|nr:hypothetical protein [Myxococcota bacterium]